MKKYTWPILIVLILAFVHLFIFTKSVSLKYEVANLKVNFNKEYQDNRYLNNSLAEAESLDKIEKVATGKLGMYYPPTINYIVLSKEAK